MNLANATRRTLATTLAEAQKTLPQAGRATTAPTPAEAALELVLATCCMLRRTTPEMKSATPPSNARSKRPRNAVRLTELLGGGAHTLAAPVNEATMPAL